jgi:alpha-glucosidase
MIEAQIGKHVIIARRSGEDWYLAAITNWEAKDFEVKTDFLDGHTYNCQLFKDGPNAGTRAIDYEKEEIKVTENDTIKISMASGGGWVARISPRRN